jgi:glycosyltransferase involved in cell wall biosynthesis
MQIKAKKKILVFIDWYLPGYMAGGPVRSMANMTGHLSAEFDFHIVTRNNEYGETTPYTDTVPDSWNDLMPGVKVWYCSEGKASIAIWQHLIKTTRCDVVYINGIYSPMFSMLPIIAAKLMRFKKVIVAPRGMFGKGALDIKPFKKMVFIKTCKVLGLYHNILWHATAETEKQEIEGIIDSKVQVQVIPNLAKPVLETSKISTLKKEPHKLKLCFISRISRKKNLAFALEVLKDLPHNIQVNYDLYGPIDDPVYWRRCEEIIKTLSNNIEINYKGAVTPDEIGPTFRKYHAFLFPTNHENFGHVILESLIEGRPVIISDQTPWRNLHTRKAGWDLSLNNPKAFVEVLMLLDGMTQVEFEDWCGGAFILGEESANDESLLKQYRNLLGKNN